LSAAKTRRNLRGLTAVWLALFAAPAFASNCESLATLHLPHTTITRAETVAEGTFIPPEGKPLPDLRRFAV